MVTVTKIQVWPIAHVKWDFHGKYACSVERKGLKNNNNNNLNGRNV